jgi:predicted phosphoribosyltransferase
VQRALATEELAMGAIVSGGLLVLDERLVRSLGIDETQLERAIDTE